VDRTAVCYIGHAGALGLSGVTVSLSGRLRCGPTTGPGVRLDTSSEEVGEATLVRPARSPSRFNHARAPPSTWALVAGPGPFDLDIAAPRETVYAAAAAPYADRQPRAMQEKVEILERVGQMVLAAHRTAVGSGLTAVTVETVTLDPPNRMGFRLLRGPVPHVIETFTFDETVDGTRFSYTGELGTDLWRLGQAWDDLVARSWVHAVRDSMAAIKTESERRAQR
jgi:Polyketide cyclase / dehydrase and lipid transport